MLMDRLAAFVVTTLVFGSVVAVRADSPPVRLADDTPLTMATALSNEDPLIAQVINVSNRPVTVHVAVSSFGLEDLTPALAVQLVAAKRVVGSPAADLVVTPSAVLDLRLRLPSFTGVKVGRYPKEGAAILTVTAPGAALHRSLAITVTKPAVPAPVVTDVRIWAYRHFAWSQPMCADCDVRVDAATAGLPNETIALSGKLGGIATLTATPGPETSSQSLRLSLTGAPRAGEYSGSWKVGQVDDKAHAVALSLTVKDEVWLPLAVLVLGTLAGLGAKRYVTVVRVIWRLRQREATIARAAEDGDAAFQRAAIGQPYMGSSLGTGFDAASAAVIQSIDRLERESSMSVNDASPTAKTLEMQLTAFQSGADTWARFPGRLGDLEALRPSIAHAAASLPAVPFTQDPPIIDALSAVLRPRALSSLEEFTQWTADVDAAHDFAVRWLKEATLLATSSEWADRLERMFGSNAVSTARDEQRQASRGLRAATSVSDIDGQEVQKHTTHANDALALVGRAEPRQGAVRKLNLLFAPTGLEFAQRMFAPQTSRPAPPSPKARWDLFARKTRHWDHVVTVVALAIAATTAMQHLYLDKPFGTLSDYLGLFLLAFGARAATDAVAAALDWVLRPSR